MSLKDIEEKIIADAELEAERITSNAHAKAKEMLDAAQLEARRDADMELNDARLLAEKEQMQALSLARLAARDKLLSLKGELISDVYQSSLLELKELSKTDYEKITKRILELMGPLPPKVEVAYPVNKEKQTEEALRKAKAEMRLPTDFRFTRRTFDSVGGFILSTAEMQIDGSFELLLEGLKKEIEPEIVKTLFGVEK